MTITILFISSYGIYGNKILIWLNLKNMVNIVIYCNLGIVPFVIGRLSL